MDGRLVRLSRRMSQAELALRAGVSQSVVSRIETGARRVSLAARARVAAAVAELLAESATAMRPPPIGGARAARGHRRDSRSRSGR